MHVSCMAFNSKPANFMSPLSEQDRKVAVLLYGFPPGVGATGTAALLNVPRSLSKLLDTLRAEGYDLGQGLNGAEVDGEAVIATLKAQEQQRAIAEGARGIERWCVTVHLLACLLVICSGFVLPGQAW